MKRLLPFLLFLVGCSSVPPARFPSVAVAFPHRDLKVRKRIESRMARCLARYGIVARPSYEVFPPPRDLGEKGFRSTLNNANIRSLLVLVYEDVTKKETLVGAQWMGDFEIPGYATVERTMTVNAHLYDLKTLTRSWSKSIQADNAYAVALEANMTSDICTQLIDDEILAYPKVSG